MELDQHLILRWLFLLIWISLRFRYIKVDINVFLHPLFLWYLRLINFNNNFFLLFFIALFNINWFLRINIFHSIILFLLLSKYFNVLLVWFHFLIFLRCLLAEDWSNDLFTKLIKISHSRDCDLLISLKFQIFLFQFLVFFNLSLFALKIH